MITNDQVRFFARQFKTNESTVRREYLQIFFLNKLYKQKGSSKIFFKGGTAIHLLFGAPRFSEDLDFTVELPENKFISFINSVFNEFSQEEDVAFKERKTLAGKRFLLTAKPTVFPYATFTNLDFSFREKVMQPEKSILDTTYPVVFTSFVYHLSLNEICAEKIRAILTRQKGRDFFDLWFLISKGASLDNELVKKKLQYYKITGDQVKPLIKKIQEFPTKEFVADLRPFVPINERGELEKRFEYIKAYLSNKLSGSL